MFAFPGMMMPAAEAAGIEVPYDPENFDKEKFPKFHVFVRMQVGRPMPYSGCVFDNAKLIASLSDDQAKTITLEQLVERGYA